MIRNESKMESKRKFGYTEKHVATNVGGGLNNPVVSLLTLEIIAFTACCRSAEINVFQTGLMSRPYYSLGI